MNKTVSNFFDHNKNTCRECFYFVSMTTHYLAPVNNKVVNETKVYCTYKNNINEMDTILACVNFKVLIPSMPEVRKLRE